MEMLRFFENLPHFDFDLPNADGETPLFEALWRGKLDIVKFLVNKGARLNHESYKNK